VGTLRTLVDQFSALAQFRAAASACDLNRWRRNAALFAAGSAAHGASGIGAGLPTVLADPERFAARWPT